MSELHRPFGVRVCRPQILALEARVAPAVVTTANDEDDYDPSDPGNWAGKDGQLSLREAIREINKRKGGVITFSGPMTINIDMGDLPPITSTVTITGPTVGQGAPGLTLSGSGGGDGLTLTAAHSAVFNLVINGFGGTGLLLNGASGSTVQNCYLGTDPSGSSAAGNGTGLAVVYSPGSKILDNVLSGNSEDGMDIDGPWGGGGTKVYGNMIGMDVSGQNAVPNGADGVWLGSGTTGNKIGGASDQTRNVISGNGNNGVTLDMGSAHNVIQGNYIGVAADGTTLIGNGSAGVAVVDQTAKDNIIGGTSDAARNIIAHNGYAGVQISRGSGNKVEGNYIGADTSGTGTNAGNGAVGVAINNGATKNVIGGTSAADRNVIIANPMAGVLIDGSGTSENKVEGNYVGVDLTGSTAAGNGDGVEVSGGATGNTIGGSTAARNVISGNSDTGVLLTGPGTNSNEVLSNFIGVDDTGTGSPVANGSSGVEITGGASSNEIGKGSTSDRNVIAGNGADGVLISDSGTGSNSVEGNYIGLSVDGATPIGNGENGVNINTGASSNEIGGPGSSDRNVIVHNGMTGVAIDGANTNAVFANYIGLDASGKSDGNGLAGITISGGAQANQIGSGGGSRNIISGNPTGITLGGSGTTSNKIDGNYIGTDPTGKTSLGDMATGISVSGTDSEFIGSGDGNTISGSQNDGIDVSDGATNIFIQNNRIGTDPTGTKDVHNGADGINVAGGSSDIQIGDNVISANQHDGLNVVDGVHVNLTGNKIGTAANGKGQLGNGQDGIEIGNGTQCDIGGSTDKSNVISGNGLDGVAVNGGAGNQITGNSIFGNGFLGIALNGGNNNQPAPTLTGASYGTVNGKATLTLQGTINEPQGYTFRLDLYENKTTGGAGPEGQTPIGFVDVTVSDAAGDFTAQFNIPKPAHGTVLTVTSTDTTNGTSPFSAGGTL